jgi:hypothetical protein
VDLGDRYGGWSNERVRSSLDPTWHPNDPTIQIEGWCASMNIWFVDE